MFSRSKIGEYRQIKYGGSLGLGTQVKKLGNLIIEGKFQRHELRNINSDPIDVYKINLASLKFGLSIDSQNKYPYPTSGVLLNTYYETAQKVLGSDVAFTKFFADYTSYFSLNSLNTISTAFTIGSADETLPLSEQFSFGGQNNFFGYKAYDFRGRQIFKASIEYRYAIPHKIFFDTYIKLRYDLGSIWTQTEQIKFKDLRHGLGATVSLDTPIGPADFSVGKSFLFKNTFKKNSISWGETFFYFTIGYYY
jgi:NTE family protein